MMRGGSGPKNKETGGRSSSPLDLKDLIDTKQVDLNTSVVRKIIQPDGLRERACLVVLQGAEVGEIIPLDKKGVIIGRSRDCSVMLKGDGISRTHARIELTDGDQAIVQDLGSTNGTFVKSRRIGTAALKPGETVLLGEETVLKFMLQDQIDQLYASYARERLAEAKEEESARIARELHDELGQILTRMKTDLALLDKKLKQERWENAGHYADRVSGLLELTGVAIKTVQGITKGLRPVMLDNLGLVATVEWFLKIG